MKFSKKTAAAVLMAALSTGAYAQVSQQDFDDLKAEVSAGKAAMTGLFNILLDNENNAVDPKTGEAVVDEAGNPIKAGLIPALADQIENNTKSIADTDANVDELYKAVNDHEDKFVALDARQAENRAVIEALANTTVKSFEELDNAKADKKEIDAVYDSIAITDDNVATLFDKTNANEDKISALDARQAENRTTLLALAETTVKSFEELDNAKADKKEIDAVYDSIAITDDNVQELYDVTNEHEAALLALDEKQAANAANIEILTDVKADKEYVDNNLTNIINHVNNATNVIGQEVGKVKDATNTNKAAIANLDGRVEIAEQAIKVVGETLNETGLAVIEGFKDHRGRISTVAQNVAKVNDRVTRTRTEVKDLQANKANKTDVDTLATTVAAKADKTYVDENFAKKADSTTVNAGLATKADKVEVAALGKRVSELDSNLKSGLAANAALNGLFQPYNVGKVNVTAALGGYKSTTALAIGAGYRVNENFAAKAGIATALRGDSGFTYNLGVNYEF